MSNSDNITMVKSKSKCDLVVEQIMSKIAQGVYKEGDKLPAENYFVEYFGVSRVTVREAFKKLNTLGLITIKQGDGTFINKVGLGTLMKPLLSSVIMDDLSVEQIYDARLFVEIGNVRLAARNRTEEDIEQLKKLIRHMDLAIESFDNEAFSEFDAQFHESIGKASKNYILLSTYATIQDILHSYIKKTNISRETVLISTGHHAKIAEYIEAHNESMAGNIMEQHVEHAKRSLINQLEREGSIRI